eukprot:3113143-Amphidinium_carterae.1
MKEEISVDVEPLHIPPPPGLDPIPHPEEAIPMQPRAGLSPLRYMTGRATQSWTWKLTSLQRPTSLHID